MDRKTRGTKTDLKIDMEEVFAAVNTTYAVVKIKPEKFRSYGI